MGLCNTTSYKGPTSLSFRMELVWHGEFDRLFRALGYTWHLLPTTTPPCGIEMYLMPSELYMPSIPWNMFLDSAKVRFCCEVSKHPERVYVTTAYHAWIV